MINFMIGEEQQVPSVTTLPQHEETGIKGIFWEGLYIYTQ